MLFLCIVMCCEQYKAQVKQARDNMEKLENDNQGMLGLIGALESAGSAGGQLGSIIASSMSAAQKPTAPMPDVSKAFSSVWKANLEPGLQAQVRGTDTSVTGTSLPGERGPGFVC
jgi:hypothetical protein